jgi:hypothetical protein
MIPRSRQDDEERSQRRDEEREQPPCRELDPGQRAAAEVQHRQHKHGNQVTGQHEAESLSVHEMIVVFFKSKGKRIFLSRLPPAGIPDRGNYFIQL